MTHPLILITRVGGFFCLPELEPAPENLHLVLLIIY